MKKRVEDSKLEGRERLKRGKEMDYGGALGIYTLTGDFHTSSLSVELSEQEGISARLLQFIVYGCIIHYTLPIKKHTAQVSLG